MKKNHGFLIPITISDANEFVRQYHRHHKPVQGGLFAVAVGDEKMIHGVAIIGRPVSRIVDDGWTAEITRVATDGSANACSMLYGAAGWYMDLWDSLNAKKGFGWETNCWVWVISFKRIEGRGR